MPIDVLLLILLRLLPHRNVLHREAGCTSGGAGNLYDCSLEVRVNQAHI
jgi:hypothetical protein